MKTSENLKIDEKIIEAWNKHDTVAFTSLCDQSIIWKDPEHPEGLKGVNAARDFFNGWKTAFPDLKIKKLSSVVSEEGIAVEYEFTGTHNGTLRTSENVPEIEPTHRKVITRGSYFAKSKDGKITSVHNYPDRVGLMMQLGIMPEMHA